MDVVASSCISVLKKHAAARQAFEQLPLDTMDVIYSQWHLKVMSYFYLKVIKELFQFEYCIPRMVAGAWVAVGCSLGDKNSLKTSSSML